MRGVKSRRFGISQTWSLTCSPTVTGTHIHTHTHPHTHSHFEWQPNKSYLIWLWRFSRGCCKQLCPHSPSPSTSLSPHTYTHTDGDTLTHTLARIKGNSFSRSQLLLQEFQVHLNGRVEWRLRPFAKVLNVMGWELSRTTAGPLNWWQFQCAFTFTTRHIYYLCTSTTQPRPTWRVANKTDKMHSRLALCLTPLLLPLLPLHNSLHRTHSQPEVCAIRFPVDISPLNAAPFFNILCPLHFSSSILCIQIA